MATPWIFRETDPAWREDHDYRVGTVRKGSDGVLYVCLAECGPNVPDVGAKDPVEETDYWTALLDLTAIKEQLDSLTEAVAALQASESDDDDSSEETE